MTGDKIALRELLEKGSDASFLREMISFAAERLMALESDALCGAGHGERSESRTNSVTAIATGTGIHGLARSSCVSQSCAKAATFLVSSSRAG